MPKQRPMWGRGKRPVAAVKKLVAGGDLWKSKQTREDMIRAQEEERLARDSVLPMADDVPSASEVPEIIQLGNADLQSGYELILHYTTPCVGIGPPGLGHVSTCKHQFV
jgi:hypothetical protein